MQGSRRDLEHFTAEVFSDRLFQSHGRRNSPPVPRGSPPDFILDSTARWSYQCSTERHALNAYEIVCMVQAGDEQTARPPAFCLAADEHSETECLQQMTKAEWTRSQIEDALNVLVARGLVVRDGDRYYLPVEGTRTPPWSRPPWALSAEKQTEH